MHSLCQAHFIPSYLFVSLALLLQVDAFRSSGIVESSLEAETRAKPRAGKGKRNNPRDDDKGNPDRQQHQKPPMLPSVSFSHLAAHRRDASLAMHLSSSLEASISAILRGAISSADSIANLVDVPQYLISRKASEPVAKSSCRCGRTWRTDCMLPCGLMAGELQQSAELLAVGGCSEDTGISKDESHHLILHVRVHGRPVSVQLEHNNTNVWFKVISGSFFDIQHAAPDTVASEDIPWAGAETHLLSSRGIALAKRSLWIHVKKIHAGSAIEGFQKLRNRFCNKEDPNGIEVTLFWPTQFNQRLQQLGDSFEDLASLLKQHHVALADFVRSCVSFSNALVRATLAVDPGEAMVIEPNARAVQNRLLEEMKQLNETADSFLRFVDSVSLATNRAYHLANASLRSWKASSQARSLYPPGDDDPEDTPEFIMVRALEQWTPTQLEGTLLLAVDGARRDARSRVKHMVETLSRASNRAMHLLQPGQPPVEVEPEELQTYAQTSLYEVAVNARQSGKIAKATWAERWSKLRESLDFIPWPVDASEKPMQTPIVCESKWYDGETLAKFPELNIPLFGKFGGKPISHTFMIFAGGDMPKRRGCEELAYRMADVFVELSPRNPEMKPKNKKARQQYAELRKQAGLLGCQHLVQWGATVSKAHEKIEQDISSMQSLHLNISYNAAGSRLVELDVHSESQERKTRRHRRMPRDVMSALSQWVMHSVTKYASRSPVDMFQGVLKSLQTTNPRIDAFSLAQSYWKQLQDQGIASPFSDVLCKRNGDEHAEACDEWNSSVPGYWASASITGQSLEHILKLVRDLEAAAAPDDWRLLAQSSAAFAAVGFDGPGIVDNSDWKCDRVAATCSVHPTCGRVAAQMLAYPFGGDKKYASAPTSKIRTFFGQTLGQFDGDGFHSYCHAPGTAYCWSYTYCLEEMMKYLCSQPETAGVCCPDAQAAEACRDDVNGDGCKVCLPTDAPPLTVEEKDVNATEFLSYLPPTREPTPPDDATLRWLQPSANDIAETQSAAAAELLTKECQVCSELRSLQQPSQGDAVWWLMVSTGAQCSAHREFCGQVCGLYDGKSAFKEPDEMSDCKGWTQRCSERCADTS
eukprot:TRINITY_DN42699_c0_g1_i1.p1 TRINITY_DN42699_c0_g1~~TRINITY_DN42699_c0_g1_i1.p1  ORF type:complete len:1098 (-),score=183.94 TRINITY_DN42699_c0_g1_i1:17-3310(-)